MMLTCGLTERALLLGLLVFALALSLTGFVLEYGFGVLPCQMCWWQRYVHWALAGLALLGLLGQKRVPNQVPFTKAVLGGIALAALGGLGIAVWQFAAQHGWLPFPASCTSHGAQELVSGTDLLAAVQTTQVVPCDKESFRLLGLSLAGWNIPMMLAVLVVVGSRLRGGCGSLR